MDAQDLTPLHPDHRKVMAIVAGFFAVPVVTGALIAEAASGLPLGLFIIPAVLAAAWFVFGLPGRRYRAKGFAMGQDRLRVAGGLWFRKDTVVPFGRVQHLDVEQGPIERMFGLATLVLHTAGNHNASVHLAGLPREDALEMRETIRAHIGRETT